MMHRRLTLLSLMAAISCLCVTLLLSSLPLQAGIFDRASQTVLVFGGDVMLGRTMDLVIRKRGPRYIWGDVLPHLQNADATLVNLECVLSDKGRRFMPPRKYYFRASPGNALPALNLAGIDFVSLANNHMMDYQAPALLQTLKLLKTTGIKYAGAGANLAAARKPALIKAGDMKIGVISFADHHQFYAAGPNTPGTNYISVNFNTDTTRQVSDSIKKARTAGADLIIFSIHWGPNKRQVPLTHFKVFARSVMDAGADIFFGHSAHIFQGIEIYKGKPIFYDTGDLINDYALDKSVNNDQQLLFRVILDQKRPTRIELLPLKIRNYRVMQAGMPAYSEIRKRLRQLSKPYGTRIKDEGRHLTIEISDNESG